MICEIQQKIVKKPRFFDTFSPLTTSAQLPRWGKLGIVIWTPNEGINKIFCSNYFLFVSFYGLILLAYRVSMILLGSIYCVFQLLM